MPDAHGFNRFCNPPGLRGIGWERLSRFYAAKLARPGAHASKDHKCGSSCTPALTDIRAISGYTDGIEVVMVYQTAYLLMCLTLLQS
jgi:hypothetical protein